MTDNRTKKQRSYCMSQIKSKDTGPEMLLRKKLFSLGFRYRVNYKQLQGKPDIVFVKKRIAIFINGCFWHGHQNCKNAKVPKTNKKFWEQKVVNNKKRDSKNKTALEDVGWKVITIWECELEKLKFDNTIKRLSDFIINS